MHTKIVIGSVVVIAIAVAGYFYTYMNTGEAQTTKEAPISTEETSLPAPEAQTYTLTEVSAHSSKETCWSVINNKVYDLTEWIKKHPGGSEAILGICGKDGSTAFNGKHGGDTKPESALTNFYIGDLATQ